MMTIVAFDLSTIVDSAQMNVRNHERKHLFALPARRAAAVWKA
jgi:hypothetical protein